MPISDQIAASVLLNADRLTTLTSEDLVAVLANADSRVYLIRYTDFTHADNMFARINAGTPTVYTATTQDIANSTTPFRTPDHIDSSGYSFDTTTGTVTLLVAGVYRYIFRYNLQTVNGTSGVHWATTFLTNSGNTAYTGYTIASVMVTNETEMVEIEMVGTFAANDTIKPRLTITGVGGTAQARDYEASISVQQIRRT